MPSSPAFADATGYRTLAERPLDPALYPGASPELLKPGSAVFFMPAGTADMRDMHSRWAHVPGASWRHPDGPASTLDGREQEPVVHVAFEDAAAYAAWSGKALPTEAEWEFAARGGLDGATFCWGEAFTPEGRYMANTWQGPFPFRNLGADGFVGRAPVGSFPPNGYGLYDMAGNVWEWTEDWYSARHSEDAELPCCVPRNPRGGARGAELRSGPTCSAHPAQGDQGRVVSVRAELLPALPASRAPSADDRLRDLPYRLPLHRASCCAVSWTSCAI